VYVHAYSAEFTSEGSVFGWSFGPLSRIFPWVTRVISENRHIIDVLVDTYGYGRDRFACIYQPVEPIPVHRRRPAAGSLRVLWAGRLDRQKRPDLLLKIAGALERTQGIALGVYGKPMLDKVLDPEELSRFRNTKYHGPYDGFGRLPLQEYDICLYTSDYDGMPNVVLEALSSGLVVVASDIGGIHEVVEDGENGLLIGSNDDPGAFVEALVSLRDDPDMVDQFRRASARTLERQHSERVFASGVRALFG